MRLGPGCRPVVNSQESEGADARSWLLSTKACCAGRDDKVMVAVGWSSGRLTFSSCSYQTSEARFLNCHVTSITSPTFSVCHVKSLLFMMMFLDTIHCIQASDESASAPTPSIFTFRLNKPRPPCLLTQDSHSVVRLQHTNVWNCSFKIT